MHTAAGGCRLHLGQVRWYSSLCGFHSPFLFWEVSHTDPPAKAPSINSEPYGTTQAALIS